MPTWSHLLMASLLVLSTACGDDGSPPAEGDSSSTGTSSTGTSPTTNGPMPTPPADSTTTDSTTSDSTTSDSTTSDSTTTDGPGTTSGSSSDGGSSDSSDGGGSSSSDGGGSSSSSDGGSSTTAADPCAAGDGPDFMVTNFGASDYVIDGVNDPALVVVRGCSYTFDVNAPGHPLFIKTAPVTGVGSTYDDGVANNGTSGGLITWDVPMAAPDALFYICEFHASMVGTITVIDP